MNSFKNLTILSLSFFFILFASSCSKEEIRPQTEGPELAASGHAISLPSAPCGTPEVADLRDPSGNSFGSIELLNDKTDLYVHMELNQGWFVAEYKIYAGPLTGIPKNEVGTKLMIEKFPFVSTFRQPLNTVVARIPHGTLASCPQVVVWTRVVQLNFFGNVIATKYAWLDGPAVLDGYAREYCMQNCPSQSVSLAR